MSIDIDHRQIVQLREGCHWTQEDLAVAAGISARTVQRIEATGQASLETLRALAAAFDVSTDSLKAAEIDRFWMFGPIMGMMGATIGCAFAFVGAYTDAMRDGQAFWSDPVTWFIAVMWAFAMLFPFYVVKRHWNTTWKSV